jgi:hypothetical protein
MWFFSKQGKPTGSPKPLLICAKRNPMELVNIPAAWNNAGASDFFAV